MDGRTDQSTTPATARADAVNVAEIVRRTGVEGPGERLALWVQGCPLRCAGCCNPHLLEFRDANWRAVDEVIAELVATPGIEGVTFLGGEPFSQAEALAKVARGVRAAGLSVMIFSGFTIEALRGKRAPAGAAALLAECDILVDGPYVASRASQDRRWIGSDNQRAHILTDRYAALAGDGWPRGDHGLEIRLSATEISINGHPRQELIDIVRELRWAQPATRRDADGERDQDAQRSDPGASS